MVVLGSIAADASSLGALVATFIAVGGFLGHTRPALARQGEVEVRRATVGGGLFGLAVAVLVLGISIWLE